MNIYLGTKSTSISRAESTQNRAHDNRRDGLIQRQAHLGTQDTNWEGSNMASDGPPQEKDIEDGRWSLVLLMDAIYALRLNAHLLIQPLFPAAHPAQETSSLLQVSGPDDLLRVGIVQSIVGDDGVGFELGLGASGFKIVLVLHIGLIAVNEVGHPAGSVPR